MTTLEDAKRLIIEAGHRLIAHGLIARTWGNISHRIDKQYFLITPSGRDYRSLTPEDLVVVRIADGSYEGSIKPSSEKGVHAAVYAQFPEVHFVIHTHQTYASVISACGLDSIPVDHRISSFSGEVLCTDYALPSTKKLARNVARTLAKTQSKAIIMKHHGVVCFGADMEEAFSVALQLEDICKRYISVRTLLSSQNSTILPTTYYSSYRTDKGFVLFNDLDKFEVYEEPIDPALPADAHIHHSIYNTYSHINYISWHQSPEVIAISTMETSLKPLLDDFAQLIGTSARVVDNHPSQIAAALKRSSAVIVRGKGALCCSSTQDDLKAIDMVLEKNCKAYIGAISFGHMKPINYFESLLMRFIYVTKYSKQALNN